MNIISYAGQYFRNLTGQSIQATEGSRDGLIIESMLTGQRLNLSMPGLVNAYSTYEAQVAETYRKYNGMSDFGGAQTRAIVDLRSSFIAGEGLNVSSQDDALNAWMEKLIDKNQLGGTLLSNLVRGGEMAGQSILVFKVRKEEGGPFVKVGRIPYTTEQPYRATYDGYFPDEVKSIEVKKHGQWEKLKETNFVYVRTGGDDWNQYGPTTRTGLVLTDIENYDRALKDMRRNNHIMARITPTFKVNTPEEAKSLQAQLNNQQWKIGKAFMGTAEFDYKTPGGGAHENLLTEMTSTLKTISSPTGVPVHWLGFVDLMSNRATAETLYDLIKNATQVERLVWEKALYDTILKCQELYIDAGGKGIKLNPDFKVTLPLLDFNNFLDRVKGYNIALGDDIISKEDYRNAIPGIDPIRTKKAIDEEKKDSMDEVMNRPLTAPNLEIEEDEGGENPLAKEESSRSSDKGTANERRRRGRPQGS
jgi:hypothetical protein